MNVRRAPRIRMIFPRVGARFYGDKTIAALSVCEDTPAAREIRVERCTMLVHSMTVPARRVRLPNFNQRSGNGVSFFIQYAPAHDDAFSEGFPAVLVSQVIIVRTNVAMAENGAGEFG